MYKRSSSASRLAASLLCMLLLPVLVYAESAGKTLLIVAHPDDEYFFAATAYRMAVQLHVQVDELIITDGEGGFRYSTLAEPYYNKSLAVEAIGRRELPAIRRKEALRAGRILGINRHFFLNQRDEGFTTDEKDGLNHGWNSPFITDKIVALLRREHYQYVFSILPRSTTHGHHQAATAFATKAIHSLPERIRPVLLAFDTDPTDFIPAQNVQDPLGWPLTYAYAFDRTSRFGFQNALDYQIIVNWMIAEHKSQGLLQTLCGKDPKEYIWIDFASSPEASQSAKSLFGLLNFGSIHLGGLDGQ
jgi:LmbE family N-acetylglucosaminyl deacetylase